VSVTSGLPPVKPAQLERRGRVSQPTDQMDRNILGCRTDGMFRTVIVFWAGARPIERNSQWVVFRNVRINLFTHLGNEYSG